MIWPFKKKTKPEAQPPLEMAQLKSKAKGSPERDARIERSIDAICKHTFPENEHNRWHQRYGARFGLVLRHGSARTQGRWL